jgi:hypothetical protein
VEGFVNSLNSLSENSTGEFSKFYVRTEESVMNKRLILWRWKFLKSASTILWIFWNCSMVVMIMSDVLVGTCTISAIAISRRQLPPVMQKRDPSPEGEARKRS